MELSAFQLRGELGRAKADAKVVFTRVCANSFYIYLDSMCCHCRPGFIRNFMCLKNEFTFWLGASSIFRIFFFFVGHYFALPVYHNWQFIPCPQ